MKPMKRHPGFLIVLLLSLMLVACGGGGGDRASGVTSVTEPNNVVPPPTPVLPSTSVSVADIQSTDSVRAEITGVSLNSPLTITFKLTVNGVQTVSGLTTSNVRFSLAQLLPNAGNAKGDHWQSYITTTEDPVCRSAADVSSSTNQCTTYTTETDPALIPDSARKVQDVQATGKVAMTQATTENKGTLAANADGSWRYTFQTDLGDPTAVTNVHRACIQYSLAASVDNSCVDFVPSLLADSATAPMGSSLSSGFYNTYSGRQIATVATCNTCHAKLALHGGGRTQVEYCVTCHNPSTGDANSGNNLDLKVLVHKIHFGRSLPSLLDDGLAYKIWGYRNSLTDFSHTSYPQPITNCTRCHAGQKDVDFATAQGLPAPTAQITADGHSWVSHPTLSACTSCHEKLQQNIKLDGTALSQDHSTFTEQTNCAGCHKDQGAATPNPLQADEAHRDLLDEAGRSLTLKITAVTNAGVGQEPLIDFTVDDANGPINLQDNAVFCPNASFDVRIPWDSAGEFLNVDSGGTPASSPRIRGTVTAANLIALGSNVFRIDTSTLSSTTPIPTGIDSIAVMIDTHYPQSGCSGPGGGGSGSGNIRLDGVVKYVATSGGTATARRTIVSVDKCANCHGRFIISTHSGLRGVNNPVICTACHNPARGQSGTSHDMSVMVHAVHASAMRESPYKGTYDETALQFPGNLANCASCHDGTSYTLPLPLTRAPVLSDTNLYTTPVAAVCSSCHDSALAKAHMETAGGAQFNQPYANAAGVTETCSVCHGTGAAADVATMHAQFVP